MGLFRIAVGVGLVVLLLPSDEGQQQRLYHNAAYAVERATTFCDRNARTCETANSAWGVFVRKLEFGAKLVYDMATTAAREDDQQPRLEPAAVSEPGPARTPPVRYAPQRPDDPQAWRRNGT